MPPGELIDLSLSTDDEPSQSLGLGTGNVSKRPRDEGFLLLQDDFRDDDENLGNIWSENPTKRRRLSHEGLSKPLLDGLHEEVENYVELKSGTGHEKLSAAISDPILFTSSPHRNHATLHRVKNSFQLYSLSGDSDDDFPEDIPRASQQRRNDEPCISERTAALLARLEKPAKRKKPIPGHWKSRDKTIRGNADVSKKTDELELDSDNLEKRNSANVSKLPRLNDGEKTRAPKLPRLNDDERAKSKLEREKVRIANKVRKEEAKEAEQEKKRQLKEQKAKEKQDATAVAEVNRFKMDKKITSKEMIVDIPSSITGQVLDTQIREFFKNLEIDAASYQAPLPNIIKWRRKVKARYDHEKQYWKPIEPMEIDDEKHVICLMPAQEFVNLASTDACETNSLDLDSHVLRLKSKFPGSIPIYLIEGLNTWMRKNKTKRNRAYQSAVLSQMDNPGNAPGNPSNPPSRRKKSAHGYIDEDVIEDALLRLQVMNSCLIHHTATTTETAEWVATFTQHISTIPTK